MTLSPALLQWTIGLGLLVLGASGFVAGLRVGAAVSEPGVEEVRFINPALLDSVPDRAARSAGGFTGFGGAPALSGQVMRTGSLAAIEPGLVTIAEPSASLEISHDGGTRLFRIGAASAPLTPGDRVVVRTEDDRVTGVLRVTE